MRAWGLEILCAEPAEYSHSLTAVLLPPGHNADELRRVILERFNLSLGNGLGKLQGKVFRIGHLGDFNELMLAGTLCGIEMGLAVALLHRAEVFIQINGIVWAGLHARPAPNARVAIDVHDSIIALLQRTPVVRLAIAAESAISAPIDPSPSTPMVRPRTSPPTALARSHFRSIWLRIATCSRRTSASSMAKTCSTSASGVRPSRS